MFPFDGSSTVFSRRNEMETLRGGRCHVHGLPTPLQFVDG